MSRKKKVVLKLKGAAMVAGLGALLGTLCDFAHVLTGVLSYPDFPGYPFLIGGVQAPWVPLLMGASSLGIAWFHLWGDRWLREGYGKVLPGFPTPKRWALGLFATAFIWAGSGLLPRVGLQADIAMCVGALWILVLLDRTMAGLFQAVLTAVAGVVVEYLLSSKGYFSYAANLQGPWGVPSWLPWIYIAVSPVVAGLARRVVRS